MSSTPEEFVNALARFKDPATADLSLDEFENWTRLVRERDQQAAGRIDAAVEHLREYHCCDDVQRILGDALYGDTDWKEGENDE